MNSTNTQEPVAVVVRDENNRPHAVLKESGADLQHGTKLYACTASTEPVAVPDCPFPCGWKALHTIAVQDAAYLAKVQWPEDEEGVSVPRATMMRSMDNLIQVCRAMLKTAPVAAQAQPTYDNKMRAIAARNLRQFLTKASFAVSVDRQAALNCVDVLEAAQAQLDATLDSRIAADVAAVVETLDEGEWAEHIAKTELGQRLERHITQLVGKQQDAAIVTDQSSGKSKVNVTTIPGIEETIRRNAIAARKEAGR